MPSDKKNRAETNNFTDGNGDIEVDTSGNGWGDLSVEPSNENKSKREISDASKTNDNIDHSCRGVQEGAAAMDTEALAYNMEKPPPSGRKCQRRNSWGALTRSPQKASKTERPRSARNLLAAATGFGGNNLNDSVCNTSPSRTPPKAAKIERPRSARNLLAAATGFGGNNPNDSISSFNTSPSRSPRKAAKIERPRSTRNLLAAATGFGGNNPNDSISSCNTSASKGEAKEEDKKQLINRNSNSKKRKSKVRKGGRKSTGTIIKRTQESNGVDQEASGETTRSWTKSPKPRRLSLGKMFKLKEHVRKKSATKTDGVDDETEHQEQEGMEDLIKKLQAENEKLVKETKHLKKQIRKHGASTSHNNNRSKKSATTAEIQSEEKILMQTTHHFVASQHPLDNKNNNSKNTNNPSSCDASIISRDHSELQLECYEKIIEAKDKTLASLKKKSQDQEKRISYLEVLCLENGIDIDDAFEYDSSLQQQSVPTAVTRNKKNPSCSTTSLMNNSRSFSNNSSSSGSLYASFWEDSVYQPLVGESFNRLAASSGDCSNRQDVNGDATTSSRPTTSQNEEIWEEPLRDGDDDTEATGKTMNNLESALSKLPGPNRSTVPSSSPSGNSHKFAQNCHQSVISEAVVSLALEDVIAADARSRTSNTSDRRKDSLSSLNYSKHRDSWLTLSADFSNPSWCSGVSSDGQAEVQHELQVARTTSSIHIPEDAPLDDSNNNLDEEEKGEDEEATQRIDRGGRPQFERQPSESKMVDASGTVSVIKRGTPTISVETTPLPPAFDETPHTPPAPYKLQKRSTAPRRGTKKALSSAYAGGFGSDISTDLKRLSSSSCRGSSRNLYGRKVTGVSPNSSQNKKVETVLDSLSSALGSSMDFDADDLPLPPAKTVTSR